MMTHDKLFRMAGPDDNEYLRDRVLDLLPDGWRKVDEPDWGEAGKPTLRQMRLRDV